ncbi:MAG TPA: hypothetical protein VGQ37_13020 [Vicinamibacterales bacterium]|nr:hypothetical protein [Vicinamibacterales bacterium]
MRATLVTAAVLGALAPTSAQAQSQVTVVPAVALSTMYDDNLFSAPSGVADVLTTIRPSIETRVVSPRLNVQSLAYFDAQRSANTTALNTLDARRHAMVDVRGQASPVLSLGMAARYDRSETPGELNLDTGILLDRQEAHRVQLTPSLSYRSDARTSFSTRYDWTSERLSGWPGGDLQALHANVAHEVTPRTTLNARYLGRLFTGELDAHSQSVLAGWAREMSPGVNLSVEAGPRVTSRRGLRAEVLAALLRRTPRTRVRLDYWRGETIVLGIPGPVEIHSGTTNLSWTMRRYFDVGTQVGVFSSHTVEDTAAVVYHAALVGAWSRQPYILSVSYGTDVQKGDIRSRGAADEYVRRGVFLVRLTVAPRLSRAFRPRGDAEQPLTPLKGVIE